MKNVNVHQNQPPITKNCLKDKYPVYTNYLINTYSIKQPDLFWNHKNGATSLVKFCIEHSNRRRVFSVNFD